MGNIHFYDEKILFNVAQIVMSDDLCCCQGEDCPQCSSSTPATMVATFGSVTEVVHGCADYNDWNRAHDLPQKVGDACEWNGKDPDDTSSTCAGPEVDSIPCYGAVCAYVDAIGGSTDVLVTVYVYEGGTPVALFQKTVTDDDGKIDCRNIGDVPLIWGVQVGSEWSGATCSLSA